MNIRMSLMTAAVAVALTAGNVAAEERMLAGKQQGGDLIASAAGETVTAPGRVLTETGDHIGNYGVGGIVTGPVTGAFKGAGQAMRGSGRLFIGIMDVLTAPIRTSRYMQSGPGQL